MEEETILHCDCGGRIIKRLTPELVHYAGLYCEKCGKWYQWVRSPESIEKGRNKTSKYDFSDIIRFHKHDGIFCYMCLRSSDQLGQKEVMTIDHIQELQEGGLDTVENLQILCTACHKLKNWARLYMNWHHNKRAEE